MRILKAAVPLALVVLVAALVLFLARTRSTGADRRALPPPTPPTPPTHKSRRAIVRTFEKASLISGAQDWLPPETCLFLTVWHLRSTEASLGELGLSRILRLEEPRAFLDRLAAADKRLARLRRAARILREWPEHAPEQVALALFRDRSWVVASKVESEAEANELTRILGEVFEESPRALSGGAAKVGPLVARHADGWHIVGPDSGAAKDVRPGTEPGLSSVALYKEIASRMAPGEAFGYFNPASVPVAVPEELGLVTLKAAGWSSRADGISVRDSFFFWSPGKRRGIFKAFSGGRLSPKVADILPAEASIALLADVYWPNAYPDLKRVVSPYLPKKLQEEYDVLTQAAELALGRPIESVLRWFGQQSAFAAVVPGHAWPPRPLVALEGKDLPKLEPAVGKLFDWLCLLSGGKKVEQQIAEIQVRSFDTRRPSFRSPCYAFQERYLLASTHTDILARALWQKRGSLAADEGFKRLSRALPVRRSGLVYVDWPEFFHATYEWALGNILERIYPPPKAREEGMHAPAADAFLPHLEVMGGCLWSDKEGLGVESVTTCGLPSLILGAALAARTVYEPSPR